ASATAVPWMRTVRFAAPSSTRVGSAGSSWAKAGDGNASTTANAARRSGTTAEPSSGNARTWDHGPGGSPRAGRDHQRTAAAESFSGGGARLRPPLRVRRIGEEPARRSRRRRRARRGRPRGRGCGRRRRRRLGREAARPAGGEEEEEEREEEEAAEAPDVVVVEELARRHAERVGTEGA